MENEADQMRKDWRQTQSFHLEINSFEEFVAFVATIRNEDLSKLPELAAKLKESTKTLATAVKANQGV